MKTPPGGRPEFRNWVDKNADPGWDLMPLTHISKGINAGDIIQHGLICAEQCSIFKEPLAYFFYGRPAYRVGGDGAIRAEAACPFCFIFDASLITKAKYIHAFDTGAFSKRMYKHYLMEEMKMEDFSLGDDYTRPNKIISSVFLSKRSYFDGDITKAPPPDEGAEPWDFLAKAYLHLLSSPGRNEPDDRICSIEVTIGENVPLAGNLKAVIVPHTLWDENKKAPWLTALSENGVDITPYIFVPGRHPEHYHAQLEAAVRDLYTTWGVL